jgi:hypothetical protein
MQNAGSWKPPGVDRSAQVADCGGVKCATTSAALPEDTQPVDVSRDPMVSVITVHNLSQPCTNVGNRLVHSKAQLSFNGFQLRHHALLRRFPPDGECSAAPSLPAVMPEAQERKGLRFPFATSLPILCGEPPKLDQSCFLSLVLRRIQSRSFGRNHLVLRTWTASSTVFGLSAMALLANSTMVNTAATCFHVSR